MIYDHESNDVSHSIFTEISNYIEKGDMLILNNTKVLPVDYFLKKNQVAQSRYYFTRVLMNL